MMKIEHVQGEGCMANPENYYRVWNGKHLLGQFDTELEANDFISLWEQRKQNLNILSEVVHQANRQWWIDLETCEPLERNKGELLMLIVSEISEAMEGERKDLNDDKLPHRKMSEVELADALIRILDYAGGFGLDIGGAFVEKMLYNSTREDHKHESRKQANGKKW